MEKMASTGIMANLEAIRRVLRQNGTGLLSYYQQTGQLVRWAVIWPITAHLTSESWNYFFFSY